jgi:hypothetical protein
MARLKSRLMQSAPGGDSPRLPPGAVPAIAPAFGVSFGAIFPIVPAFVDPGGFGGFSGNGIAFVAPFPVVPAFIVSGGAYSSACIAPQLVDYGFRKFNGSGLYNMSGGSGRTYGSACVAPPHQVFQIPPGFGQCGRQASASFKHLDLHRTYRDALQPELPQQELQCDLEPVGAVAG